MRFLGQILVPLRNFRIVQLTEEKTKGKLPAAGGNFWVSPRKYNDSRCVLSDLERGREVTRNNLSRFFWTLSLIFSEKIRT